MRRFVYLLLLIIFIPLGLAFTVLNSQQVTIDLYVARFTLPIALVVFATLTVGALLGIFSDYMVRARYRLEIRGLHKKLTSAERRRPGQQGLPAKGAE
ncbi:MAG: LapA family protein [Gammaproteobacteria bacterium]